MYVCMYVCKPMYMCVCMYVCIYVYIYTYSMYTHTRARVAELTSMVTTQSSVVKTEVETINLLS